MLQAALTYAARGYPVFPCKAGGKAPITPNGYKDATTDPDEIKDWWRRYPSANIGIPTAGLLAVDIDAGNVAWPDDPEKGSGHEDRDGQSDVPPIRPQVLENPPHQAGIVPLSERLFFLEAVLRWRHFVLPSVGGRPRAD